MEKINQQINILTEENPEKGLCPICGSTQTKDTICQECHEVITRTIEHLDKVDHSRLKKSRKRKFWKLKGVERKCDICGFSGGGPHRAVHPFKPPDWDGELINLRPLCSTCLGVEASKRDKIFKIIDKFNSEYPQ